MKYKLIACDMDGTLLNGERRISDRSAAVIKAASERGVIFSLSTGRPPVGVLQYARQLPKLAPVIAINGALITRIGSDEILFEQALEPETASELMAHARALDVFFAAWRKNELFVSRIDDEALAYRKLSGSDIALIENEKAFAESGISKFLWISNQEKIAECKAYLDKNLLSPASYCTSSPRYLEVYSHKVSKALALQRLADILDIDISQTIAFGDGFNDLSMLKAAGLGVAMGNAAEEIKRQCDLVAPSNLEDGVADVIEKLILSA